MYSKYYRGIYQPGEAVHSQAVASQEASFLSAYFHFIIAPPGQRAIQINLPPFISSFDRFAIQPMGNITLRKNAESVIHTLFWTLDALQVALHTVPLSHP